MQEENPAGLFSKLPAEIVQHIAYLLPRDIDVINLARTCFSLADRILPAKSHVWSNRFQDLYDTPEGRPPVVLKLEYQIRRIVLPQRINFSRDEHEAQTLWLEVVKGMLLESLSLPARQGQTTSKTLEMLCKVLFDSEFLNRPSNGYGETHRSAPSDLFCAVQLCLTDVALDPSMCVRCCRKDYDAGAVYSFESDIKKQLVNSGNLDLERMLHIRNFWLRHLLNPDEASYHDSFHKLGENLRPTGQKPLHEESSKPSSYWLGYDSCLHPHPETLNDFGDRQTCGDLDTHLTQVDPMSLQIELHPCSGNWPFIFDDIIPIQGPTQNCSFFRGIKHTHGSNDEPRLVRGFMEPVPLPQGGFPGWNRICFAIYKANREIFPVYDTGEGEGTEDGTLVFPNEACLPTDFQLDFHSIRLYEGMMLPGGRIIVGRYVDMLDAEERGGPFIFWDI
ncbi:hypothetical protein PHISP_00795 [Aspergillus sp. HF37]|nr:hypothetical protein PHISP_00795 [Aspergillus sp. HF37]